MLDEVYAEWDAFLEDPDHYERQILQNVPPVYVSTDPFHNAYHACVACDKVKLYREALEDRQIPKRPDLLMGLAASKPVDVEVWVGSTRVHQLALTPVQANMILGNSVIPLAALLYHEVEFKMSRQCLVHAIYAFLPNQLRHSIIRGNWMVGSMYVAYGMACLDPFPGLLFDKLPNWIPAWIRMMERKRQQVDAYKEELMMQACRPERLWQIGID